MKETNNLKIENQTKTTKNCFKRPIKQKNFKITTGIVIGTFLLIIIILLTYYFVMKPKKVYEMFPINSNQIFLHIKIDTLIVNKNDLPEDIKTKSDFIQKLYQIKQMIPIFKINFLTFIIISNDNVFKDVTLLEEYKTEIKELIKIANINKIQVTVGISNVLTANIEEINKLLEFNFVGICGLQPEKDNFSCNNVIQSETYKLITQSLFNKHTRLFGIEDKYFHDMSFQNYFTSNVGYFLVNDIEKINFENGMSITNKPKLIFPGIIYFKIYLKFSLYN